MNKKLYKILLIYSNHLMPRKARKYKTERHHMKEMFYTMEYAPAKTTQDRFFLEPIITYKHIQLVGKFANFWIDGKSNVGFQAINENGEHRRFRYDRVVNIKAE